MGVEAQFAHWLPALLTAALVLAALGAGQWALARWLRPWASGRALAALLRRTLRAVAVLLLALLALRGSGLGVPRLTWPLLAGWLLGPGLRILFIFLGAFLLARAADFFIAHLQQALAAPAAAPHDAAERRKRIDTLGRLLRGLATLVLFGIATLMALRELHMDITPILTGAGVAGVALGFGAQTLVKDLIAGVFLILENQIRVGDIITINGKTGLVESLRLRILVLRGADGAVYIFHNGAISEYANLTKDFAYAVLDVGVAPQQDLGRVTALLQAVGDSLVRDPAFAAKILAPAEILGVESLGPTSVGLRLRIRTAPMEQWAVDRELRRRVQEQFAAAKIALA